MNPLDKLLALNVGVVMMTSLAGAAMAQVSVPTVGSVSVGDLVPDVVGGSPSAQSHFIAVQPLTSVHGYLDAGVISTGSTYAFTNSIEYIVAQASSTTGTVTLDFQVNPADGQHDCFWNLATTTGIGWAVATGQTLDGSVPLAGVAKTPVCAIYDAAKSTWFGSP